MLITADFVMWHEPPIWFPRKRVASLLGDGKTLLECLRIDELTAEERIWLATRRGACSERVHRLFACWCAEQVLPLFELLISVMVFRSAPRVLKLCKAIQTSVVEPGRANSCPLRWFVVEGNDGGVVTASHTWVDRFHRA